MIPARLKLENFMCFSNIDIDFSGLKTVCLTGKNGSGKTSILDAITWALWEKARSKSEKLIKLGRNNMKVELEFSVEGTKYKIIRYFRKGSYNKGRKQAKNLLEFFMYNSKIKSWQPLTGNKYEETQEKIVNTIKMDFDTFINSIYIRQGSPDSFITKSPEERKSILADILGLGEYEKLYKLSLEKANKLEQDAKILKEQINEGEVRQFSLKKLKTEKENILTKIHSIQEQLEKTLKEKKALEAKNRHYSVLLEKKNLYINIKNRYEDDIHITGQYVENLRKSKVRFKEMTSLEHVIEKQYEHYLNQKQLLKDLDQKEKEYHALKDRLIEYGSKQMIQRYSAEHEYKKLCEELDEKQHQINIYRQRVEKAGEIQRQYLEYKDIKDKIDNLDRFKAERCDLEVNIARLETAVKEQREHLKDEVARIKITVDEIDKKLEARTELEEKISLLEQEIKQYDKYEAELERIREKGLAQREIVIDRVNKNSFHELNLDKLKDKIELLQKNNARINCPTCDGKVLKPDDLIRKLEFEIDNIMIHVENNENDISLAEDEIKFYRVAYKEKKKYLAKRSSLMFELAELKALHKNLEIEEQNKAKLLDEVNSINNMLETDIFAEEERVQLMVLYDRRKQLEDLMANYPQMKEKLETLSFTEKALKDIEEARKQIKRIEAELPYYTMSKRTLEKEISSKNNKPDNDVANDVYNKLLALNYNLDTHINLRQELANSQQIEYDYIELQFARQHLPELENNIIKIETSLDKYLEEIDRLNTEISKLSQEFDDSEDLRKKLEEINNTWNILTEDLQKYNIELAILNERISVIDESLNTVKAKKIELDKLNKDIEEYHQLAVAFGKKGIQDIIIENSLTEIETEANKYLTKLTDNDMKLSLNSCKSNKTSTYNDKLDIYIADNQGTRSYELYSGGETYRINLAIRLAMAKLLARSRNVKLQSLIIDDAFNSVDPAGQKNVIDTINSIKGEFDLVLLVASQKLAETSFPGRIEISKEAGESSVEVVA
jgi:exonuclease SbcC